MDGDAQRPVQCLFSRAQLAERVAALGRQISADYAGKQPLVVGVLKGAFVFMADLVRQMSIPIQCDFVVLSSYGAGTETSGEPRMLLDLKESPAGRNILIVEDIVDTGTSTAFLMQHLRGRGPASVRLCALLDKPARRRTPVPIDYVGFTIPDHFVVGYGIDHAERYRELDFVGYVGEAEDAGNA
ncbi:hypoxanthine phosphoribosyltransferase [Planctomycetaceae bacterium SCGC AG-212-D15]|nr:hypoxanthine phosphoribosyltransferase [Planctomycetaceae bacterium SCGC AG-212-D15]